MTRLSFSLMLLLHVLAPLGIAGEESGLPNELRRWAIIASPEIVRDGLPDLVTASLSEDATIELVERQELATIERELQLAAYFGATAGQKRLQLGRMLKADGLVLLSIEKPFRMATADAAPMLKMLVAECRSGTRLLVDYFPYDNDKLALIAEKSVTVVNRTRRRFPVGIERTICVTPFLSKNLVHDYDDLQSGLSGLLSNALTAFPGVAVIETEEARSIGRELELSGTDLKHRNVPVLVEGEFRVSPANGGDEPKVTLVIRIADSLNAGRTIELKNLPFTEIVASLSNRLPRTVLQIAADDSTKPLSMQAQFEQLVSQANRFSMVGAWEQSLRLREAALLIKPGDTELRISLIGDYFRHLRITLAQRDRPATTLAEVEKRAAPWRIMMKHYRRLIENHGLNLREAAFLLGGIRLSSINKYRGNVPRDLCEQLRDTIWFTCRHIDQLDATIADGTLRQTVRGVTDVPLADDFGDETWTERKQYESLASNLLRGIVVLQFLRIDENPKFIALLHQSTRDEVFRFLSEVARDDMPPLSAMASMLQMSGGDDPKVFARNIDRSRFCDRLLEQKSPRLKFYGRYGKWKLMAIQKPASPDLKERRVVLELLKDLGKDGPVATGSTEENEFVRKLSARLQSQGRAAKPPHVPRANGKSDAKLAKTYRFVPLSVEHTGGYENGDTHIIRCGPDTDVLVTDSKITVRTKNLPPVLINHDDISSGKLIDYSWDGENIWLASNNDGIRVVSLNGTVKAHINHATGLPKYLAEISRLTNSVGHWQNDPHLRVHAIEPGRCIALGLSGVHGRIWIAEIKENNDAGGYTIKVFHEAMRHESVANASDDDDPQVIFKANWTKMFRTKSGRRLLLVGRRERRGEEFSGRRPLAIDLSALDVFLPDVRIPTENATLTSESFACVNGRLFQATNQRVCVYEPPKDIENGKWSKHQVSDQGLSQYTVLLLHAGLLINPGTRWHCIDPDSLAVRQLDGEKERVTKFAVTAQFGMTGWGLGGKTYRIVTDRDVTAPRQVE